MSPLVREAFLVSRTEHCNAAKGITGKGLSPKTITAFVKSDDEQPLQGCNILSRYGDLYIASVPLDRLGWLSKQEGVQRIEAGRPSHVTMDTTAFIIGATAVHEATSLLQGYTGKGVVVGVEDIGFDLTHPNFWSADMSRYRIKALWDQLSTDTIGSTLPVGRDYRDSTSLLALGHPRDGLIQTHGTHTTGIAAGSGGEGTSTSNLKPQTLKYIGIAPDADICLVCNATTEDISLIDTADYYKYTYALDALGFKYIFDYADSVGKPCVINFSEGSQEDFYGYDQLYYEMLDSLVGPGHIIVASAGNDGGKINYLHKPANAEYAAINATSQWHERSLSFTTRSDGNHKIKITSGDDIVMDCDLDKILQSADSTLADTIDIDGSQYVFIAGAYPDSYGTGYTVTDWVITSDKYIYPRMFKIQLTGDSDVELYAGSVEFSNTDDSEISGDNSHSILSPGSAPCVISVGMTGYRTSFTNYLGTLKDFGGSSDGEINVSSSVGPTYDGRVKPEVVAPGQNIISSYSSYYIENNPTANDVNSDVRHFTYNGRTYAWNSNTGTSMSSPVVAGVIALWLQANPRLTPQDCINIISKTSTHYDESLTYPNNTYGYGQIDALAGIKYILENMTGIKTVVQSRCSDNKIYTLDGRFVGNDVTLLSKGLYIINGNKVIIK